MKRTTVALLAWLLATVCACAEVSPRQILPLNGQWRFTFASGDDTWASPAHEDATWESVLLPHTWNAFDGQDGGGDYRRGTGWYRKYFQLTAQPKGQHVLVEFDGACKVADVFLNGKHIGTHTGAFARFRFDLTSEVHWTGDNVLVVRVNNAPGQIIPRSGDFTQFGGLYRSARLVLTAPVHIATLDYASAGVYLAQRHVTAHQAAVDAHVKLVNESKREFKGLLRVRVQDASGIAVTSSSENIKLSAGSASEQTLPLTVPAPHLWNGTADPYQYRVSVELVRGDELVDCVEQPLGLRSYEIKADSGFILNGQQLSLHGVCRHQDRPNKGWAISEAEHAEDFRLIQELGANAIRLAHYQHDQCFYNLCDANGMVVWAEAGFVNEAPEEPAARENAREQLRELIRQNYNHPSIFFWSIGNETTGKNKDAAAQSAEELLTELAAVVRQEDPSRLSVYASHHAPEDPRNFLTGAVAFNKYYGWYGGKYADLGVFLDNFHAAHPTARIGISEYGAGASLYQHEENPPIRKAQAKGSWHPEEWQAIFHEECWMQLQARPWLWGTFIWNMFDFANDNRAEGDQFGRNDKGLVSYDRQRRKDAFYWYQANWSTNAMVHIVSKRFWERGQSNNEVKIYSNCSEVELKVNGVSLGKVEPRNCRFVWPKVELTAGPNRLEAYGYRSGKVAAMDWDNLTYRADGDPRPNKVVAEENRAIAKKSMANESSNASSSNK